MPWLQGQRVTWGLLSRRTPAFLLPSYLRGRTCSPRTVWKGRMSGGPVPGKAPGCTQRAPLSLLVLQKLPGDQESLWCDGRCDLNCPSSNPALLQLWGRSQPQLGSHAWPGNSMCRREPQMPRGTPDTAGNPRCRGELHCSQEGLKFKINKLSPVQLEASPLRSRPVCGQAGPAGAFSDA